ACMLRFLVAFSLEIDSKLTVFSCSSKDEKRQKGNDMPHPTLAEQFVAGVTDLAKTSEATTKEFSQAFTQAFGSNAVFTTVGAFVEAAGVYRGMAIVAGVQTQLQEKQAHLNL